MEREAEQLLTQHSVSVHYSSSTDSEPESSPPPPNPNRNNIGPRHLSQRSIVHHD